MRIFKRFLAISPLNITRKLNGRAPGGTRRQSSTPGQRFPARPRKTQAFSCSRLAASFGFGVGQISPARPRCSQPSSRPCDQNGCRCVVDPIRPRRTSVDTTMAISAARRNARTRTIARRSKCVSSSCRPRRRQTQEIRRTWRPPSVFDCAGIAPPGARAPFGTGGPDIRIASRAKASELERLAEFRQRHLGAADPVGEGAHRRLPRHGRGRCAADGPSGARRAVPPGRHGRKSR